MVSVPRRVSLRGYSLGEETAAVPPSHKCPNPVSQNELLPGSRLLLWVGGQENGGRLRKSQHLERWPSDSTRTCALLPLHKDLLGAEALWAELSSWQHGPFQLARVKRLAPGSLTLTPEYLNPRPSSNRWLTVIILKACWRLLTHS